MIKKKINQIKNENIKDFILNELEFINNEIELINETIILDKIEINENELYPIYEVKILFIKKNNISSISAYPFAIINKTLKDDNVEYCLYPLDNSLIESLTKNLLNNNDLKLSKDIIDDLKPSNKINLSNKEFKKIKESYNLEKLVEIFIDIVN